MSKKSRDQRQVFLKERVLNQQQAKEGELPLIVVLDGLKPDFNIGKIFRSAEYFGVRQIHIIGTPYFDPRPSMGTFRKVKCHFHLNFNDCHTQLQQEGYELVVFDPSADMELGKLRWPKKTAIVVGHEEYGLSFDWKNREGVTPVKIPGLGVTQSLNVSVACSIGIFAYCSDQSH